VILASTEWGDPAAPSLVCLHGIRGQGLRFAAVGERLAERLHVVAYDLRGHGRSGWQAPWDLETHGNDVAETLATLPRAPAAWLAHSFGARVLLDLAARGYRLGEVAVLLDPAFGVSAGFASEQAEADCHIPIVASPEAEARARVERGAARPQALGLVTTQLAEQADPLPGGGFRLRFSPAAAVSAWSEMARPEPQLDRLPAQTLIVLASDSIVPSALHAELRDHATVRQVEGGHNLLWDAPDETIDLIEKWIRL
jgi:lipase